MQIGQTGESFVRRNGYRPIGFCGSFGSVRAVASGESLGVRRGGAERLP